MPSGPPRVKERSGRGDGLLFLIVVPLVAHAAFSWMGFNPTDDGFVLAYGRRLLDGQVPHRDFISIRPVGSPLLHLPELILAGDFVLYASRFVWWCELALVAWIWVALLARLLDGPLAATTRFALRLLVFLLSAHVAPPRAWHTVDGMLLASLGMALASGARAWGKDLGYLLVGAAWLCKQNFAVLGPLAVVTLGDWRRPRSWLAVVAPGALYVLVVSAHGGGPDLFLQLGAQHDLITGGLAAYASVPTMVGLLVGGLVGWLPGDARRRQLLAALAVLVAPLGLLTSATTGSYVHYARVSAFGLFGVAVGRSSALLWGRDVAAKRAAVLALALALAWASSVSVGYPTPAYAAGILAALILLVDVRHWMPVVALTVLTAIGFVAARTQVVYRDLPAARLDRPLGEVFPGGRGIRTNSRTHAFLADLGRAVEIARTRERPCAILPDVPGYWATSREANPLPIDWPQAIELRDPALAERVQRSITARRGDVLYLVQKVRADVIATASVPVGGDMYPLVETVRTTLTKVGETALFEIYE